MRWKNPQKSGSYFKVSDDFYRRLVIEHYIDLFISLNQKCTHRYEIKDNKNAPVKKWKVLNQ